MNFDANDPRWTAYALGELDTSERIEVEKLLRASPEARATVDEIRETAGLLSRELSGANHEHLTPAQRLRIESVAQPRTSRWPRYAVAASIVLLVGAIGASLSLPTLHRAREISPGQLALMQQRMSAESSIVEATAAPIDSRPPDEGKMAFQSSNLPPTTAAETPDLWAAVRASNLNPKEFRPPGSPPIGTPYTPIQSPPSPLTLVGPDAHQAGASHDQSGAVGPRHFTLQTLYGNEIAGDLCLWFDARDQNLARREKLIDMSHSLADATANEGQNRPANADLWYHYRRAPAEPSLALRCGPPLNTESYTHITDNPFLAVKDSPLSTFSIDVDTASYANVRRFIMAGQAPPKDAVRIEELLNYFTYDYPPPSGDQPFSANVEVAQCPWQPAHRLVRVGLRGKSFDERERPACNLVFLIDVSGSMEPANRLPLLKQSLALLVPKLGEKDRVAMVVYAGSSGLVLPSTPATYQSAILGAMENLRAGGSTNGGEGIELAYKTAAEHFITGGVNRVILCTDGDFNVGVTNQGDLVRLIEQKAKGGVFLSVLGFGMGNLKDSTLEKLADKGNGNYAYIDTLSEARKVFVDQMGGTLLTIAKDVKIQIEFNPAVANSYRLIGYENRMLAAQDFNDDKKDAGEIGAGHTVTALYEVVPAGVALNLPSVDPLKYQPQAAAEPSARDSRVAPGTSGELLTLKLRYKAPDGDTSRLMEQAVIDPGAAFTSASPDFRFAAAVAAFGMSLRDSPHKAACNLSMAEELSMGALGEDRSGYRREFLELVRRARRVTQAGSTRGTPTDPPPVRFRNPQLESPTEAAPPGR